MGKMSLAKSLETAPIGDGDKIGEPFRCLPYQRKFLAGAFKPGVLRAGLSTGPEALARRGLASALALDSITACWVRCIRVAWRNRGDSK